MALVLIKPGRKALVIKGKRPPKCHHVKTKESKLVWANYGHGKIPDYDDVIPPACDPCWVSWGRMLKEWLVEVGPQRWGGMYAWGKANSFSQVFMQNLVFWSVDKKIVVLDKDTRCWWLAGVPMPRSIRPIEADGVEEEEADD
jgi:hypothetical protein